MPDKTDAELAREFFQKNEVIPWVENYSAFRLVMAPSGYRLETRRAGNWVLVEWQSPRQAIDRLTCWLLEKLGEQVQQIVPPSDIVREWSIVLCSNLRVYHKASALLGALILAWEAREKNNGTLQQI